MEASGRGSGRRERIRLAERQAKRHGPAFLAEQRRLVTDRKDALERGSGRRRQVDLPSGCPFVPSSENHRSQIRWIRGCVAAGCSDGDALASGRSAGVPYK